MIVSTTRRSAKNGRQRDDSVRTSTNGLQRWRLSSNHFEERTEDIPALAMHFLERFCALYDRRDRRRIADDAMAQLRGTRWPGNVRELENVCAMGYCSARGRILESAASDRCAQVAESRRAYCTRVSESQRGLQDVVEQHVVRVLQDCEGNKVRAAEVLGISRSTLYRMLDGCPFQG